MRTTERGECEQGVIDCPERRPSCDDYGEAETPHQVQHQILLVERHHNTTRAFHNIGTIRLLYRQFERVESDSKPRFAPRQVRRYGRLEAVALRQKSFLRACCP